LFAVIGAGRQLTESLGRMEDQTTDASWTPRQRALVEDHSRIWRHARFQPSGAVEVTTGGTRFARKAEPGEAATPGLEVGWDHEHCALCWRKLSAYPEHEHEGFTDGEEWICGECFERYLQPRVGSSSNDASAA
jgi:hypothetical protein